MVQKFNILYKVVWFSRFHASLFQTEFNKLELSYLEHTFTLAEKSFKGSFFT